MRCVRVRVIVMSLVHFIRVCSLGLRGPLFAASGSLFISCRPSSVVRRRELLWSVDAGAGRQPSVPGGVRRAGGVTVPFLVYHAFFQSNVR